MPDQPNLPALSDDDLRETLDLMATAVASMSDRIDDLTAVADKQIKVATEARIAAFAARDLTNPKNYGDLLGQTFNSHLGATADAMTEIVRRLGVQTDKTIGALAKSENDRSSVYRAGTESGSSQKPPALVWSGCISCGPGADGDASSFLSQQRVHMRCPWGILDHDNHGCRCVRVLPAVRGKALQMDSYR